MGCCLDGQIQQTPAISIKVHHGQKYFPKKLTKNSCNRQVLPLNGVKRSDIISGQNIRAHCEGDGGVKRFAMNLHFDVCCAEWWFVFSLVLLVNIILSSPPPNHNILTGQWSHESHPLNRWVCQNLSVIFFHMWTLRETKWIQCVLEFQVKWSILVIFSLLDFTIELSKWAKSEGEKHVRMLMLSL